MARGLAVRPALLSTSDQRAARRLWPIAGTGAPQSGVEFRTGRGASGRGRGQDALWGDMLELDVHNESGEVTGSVQFDESILGEKVRKRLLQQVVVAYLANRRQGTSSAKTKAEVAGSGKKPWKQKHTGRARAGSKRSPIWTGGGVAFPPKPRDFRKSVTKSMRRQALKSALLSKFRDEEVTVVEPLVFDAPKTKRVASMLKALKIDGTCLLAIKGHSAMLHKSSRNVPKLRVLVAGDLNALDVVNHRRLVLTREVIENLAEVVR